MKIIIFTMFAMIWMLDSLHAQQYDRRFNPEYMWNSFEDDFSGEHIDRNIWKPATRFKRNLGFLVDSSLTMKVEKGKLELKMRHAPHYLDSLWSLKGWKHELSHYMGAEVSTFRKFQYGVFECRARFALRSGSWPAFWLTASDGVPCPPGGHGSEIDIAEVSCSGDFPTMMHVIHRYYPSGNCERALQVKKNEKRYLIPRRQRYATYKCIWTPQTIRYFVNDKQIHEVTNHGEEWFPLIPMNLILSQQVTQGFDLETAIRPATPQTSRFDWVKVRQFFLAPEISCPEVIPSTATATLDVDPQALQITWRLSPSDSFTTSAGKGKTAPIIRAPDATGEGKITYTFQMPSGETYTAEKAFK